MLSAQCGWLLSCLVITLLQQRAQATATTSSTPTATSSTTTNEPRQSHQQNHPQKQQQTMDNQTTETDADTETGVTCYTCVNVSDNLVCNRFAIDRPCPQGEDFCHTLHIMDSRGESVVVNKKCADSSECSPQRVGCLSIDTQTVCVSCCDEMYCNISVPSNQSTAVYSDTRTKARRRAHQHHNSSNSTNTASRYRLPPTSSQTSAHLLIVVLTAVASLVGI
ncbi:uncharacterized protein [Periplaneta americana]|uniref:uncharacterized protein isoform X1 n=1 Tax=Periplaneta americana TaxID=6978 RepID=UPI0037E974B6